MKTQSSPDLSVLPTNGRIGIFAARCIATMLLLAIVVGYDAGYRASWQTTLGGVPRVIADDNRSKWSGDHCIDPELVPGVLFLNKPDPNPPADIQSVAAWLLEKS